MRTPFKLAAFAAVLVVALAASLGLGRLSGVDGQAAAGHEGDTGTADDGHGGDHADETSPDAVPLPSGLQVSQDGYTLEVLHHADATGTVEPFEFRVNGPDGGTVTDFTESHEADLHLIVVRRDLTEYQHVHPEMADDGTWTVPLAFDRAGAYRVFADFLPTGHESLTLGSDVAVGGEFEPADVPHPERTAEVDGYTVTLDGDLTPGRTADLTLSVSHDGRPVADLQPYLGAAGHLVVLRRDDLAYLHVHPEESGTSVGAGPDVGFRAEVPSEGSYGLFFEFRHDGAVHTAEFTLEAGDGHDH